MWLAPSIHESIRHTQHGYIHMNGRNLVESADNYPQIELTPEMKFFISFSFIFVSIIITFFLDHFFCPVKWEDELLPEDLTFVYRNFKKI